MSTVQVGPSREAMTLALLAHYESAGPSVESAGLSWYESAAATCNDLAARYNLEPVQVTGIVAALSPQCQWQRNLALAEAVCEHGTTGGQTLPNVRKAEAIYDGAAPLDVLGGPKVRAFYRALTGDHSAAVVDTWMLQAVGWHRSGASAAQYARIAGALEDAAATVGVDVARLQAIVWVQVRGDAS